MTIAKPPKTPLDKRAEAIIDRAPAVASGDVAERPEEVALTVRVPPATLKRIDVLVKARRNKIPRHSWLLEAIYEKLDREDNES